MKKSAYMNILIVFPFSLFPILFNGCYTYSTGEFVKTEKTVGTTSVGTSNREVLITSYPRRNDPWLSIKLVQTPVYHVSYVDKYAELKEANKATGWTLLLLGGAAVYGGIKYNSATSSDLTIKSVLIIGGPIFLYYGIELVGQEGKIRTGNLISGSATSSTEIGSPIPIPFTDVTVNIAGRSKSLRTDRNGSASVNLINDFGFDRFDNLQPLIVLIYSQNPLLSKTFFLDPSDWTIPYLRIEADVGWIYEKSTSKSRKLGQYAKGDILQVEESSNQQVWLKIRKGRVIGWVPSLAGVRFWSTREISR
jgi:hypothetical protein